MRASVILFLMISINGGAQPRLVKEIVLAQPAKQVYIDRAGDYYILYANGTIEKRSKDGDVLSQVTPETPFATFDPTNAMRLLGFERQGRTLIWYYPDLSVYEQAKLDPAFAIEPWLVCTSGDRDFWIADAADQSLKKIRKADQTVAREFKLPDAIPPIAALTDIREYQSFIFLVHPASGIFILNPLGRLVRVIPVTGIHQVQFLGEEVIYPVGKQLVFFNLFSTDTRRLEVPGSPAFALFSDERMWLVEGVLIRIFDQQP